MTSFEVKVGDTFGPTRAILYEAQVRSYYRVASEFGRSFGAGMQRRQHESVQRSGFHVEYRQGLLCPS